MTTDTRTEQGRALVEELRRVAGAEPLSACPDADVWSSSWAEAAGKIARRALVRIAALEGALREVDEELWDNGGQDVAYLRDRIASVLTPQPAKEDA